MVSKKSLTATKHRTAHGEIFTGLISDHLPVEIKLKLFCSYSACVIYTKTIIHLSVGESGGYPPLFTSTSVNNCQLIKGLRVHCIIDHCVTFQITLIFISRVYACGLGLLQEMLLKCLILCFALYLYCAVTDNIHTPPPPPLRKGYRMVLEK